MKKIIIILVATIMSFGISFGAVWFTKSKQAVTPEAELPITSANTSTDIQPALEPQPTLQLQTAGPTRSLPERRLQNLIEDARNKISDYKNREDQLDDYQQQLEMTRQTLSEDITKLTTLYEELSQQILSLKQQEQNLNARIIEIKKDETKRLQQLAGVYDKMEEASSAKIFTNMMTNNQLDDAAKIIFFMSERKSAKVLAQMSNMEPTLARVLCTKIKHIKEQ